MNLELYCQGLVDLILGNGPLGFRLGETDDGYPILGLFTRRPDGIMNPVEAIGVVNIGYFIISVNNRSVYELEKDDVSAILKAEKRPLRIRFGKPVSERRESLLTELGISKVQEWDLRNDFLPIRCYNLTSSDPYSTFRSFRELSIKDRALTSFYDNRTIFESDIREYAYNGPPDISTRAIVWNMLLKSYPMEPDQWDETRYKHQLLYEEFVNEFVVSRNNACGRKGSRIIPDPIDSSWKKDSDKNTYNNESNWSIEFKDSSMREIIWKDVNRTYRNIPFFGKYNTDVMARLLFIFGKLNEGVQYVQGMNELLAPLLYVMAEGEYEKEVTIQVEADTFFVFSCLMSEKIDLYIEQMDLDISGLNGLINELNSYIAYHVPRVFDWFNELQMSTHFFAIRWIITMFAREFSLDETIRVWDILLGDPQRFMMSQCLGTAMIKRIEDSLLKGDFGTDIMLLQNYVMPSTEEMLTIANEIRILELKRRRNNGENENSNMNIDIISEPKKWSIIRDKRLPFFRIQNKSGITTPIEIIEENKQDIENSVTKSDLNDIKNM